MIHQMDLLRRDFALFDGLLSDEDQVVVADTSFVETAVFSARAGIEMSPAVEEWIRDPSDNGIQQNLMVGCIPLSYHQAGKRTACWLGGRSS